VRVSVLRDQTLDAHERRAAREAALGPLLRRCGDALSVPARAALTVRLADDAALRELNGRFLDVDEPTDVLAFPMEEPGRVGDVAISVEHALRQADDGASELRLLAVHGLLHCLGYDHDVAPRAAEMTALTRRLLPDQRVPDL
jgi:probable rRNA maturation factor